MKKILKYILPALIFAAAALFCGCTPSESWVRTMISEYYYRFDGDYSAYEDMDGMSVGEMVALLDPYSAYYTSDEYKSVLSDMEGNKSGIGVSYGYVRDVGVVLYSVVGGSPAFRAGLKAGDVLTGATYKNEDVIFDDTDAFSSFAGERTAGEQFTLKLANGQSCTLAKEDYVASYASMYLQNCAYVFDYSLSDTVIKKDGGMEELPPDAAYIYLSQFYGNAAEEIELLLKEFNSLGLKKLILDLRDNGGGLVDVMAEMGGYFAARADGTPVAMTAKYKDGREVTTYCPDIQQDDPSALGADVKVYAMANENTASASEALLGVLVSYGVLDYGDIFLTQYEGREAKSYGKGIMQSSFTNRFTGEALKLTVAGIYWANGKTIHGTGLLPSDGCLVAPSSDNIVNVGVGGEDEVQFVLSSMAPAGLV